MAATSIAKSDIDLFSDEVLSDPYPVLAHLRSLGGVVHLPAHDAYVLTRYHACRDALREWQTFESGHGVMMNQPTNDMVGGRIMLCTDGFGNSPQKLVEHFPSAAATEWTWYIGGDGARGDAIELGQQVGAQLVGHNHGLRLLHVNFDRVYEALLPGWLMMVDATGHRFVDETAPYGVLDAVSREHGDRVFVIFDATSLERTREWGVDQFAYPIPGHARPMSKHWNPDLVEQMVASSAVASAGTLAELAAALGIDRVGLEGTVERYNTFAETGVDDQCGKASRFLHPIADAPFYGAELRPATVCSTAFGLRITPDAEVLAHDDRPIVGLFAAGECTGNVVGPNYFGSGNNYANCCAVGRIAGRSAARLAHVS